MRTLTRLLLDDEDKIVEEKMREIVEKYVTDVNTRDVMTQCLCRAVSNHDNRLLMIYNEISYRCDD